ncbi:ankyrin repeat-containing protein BDA1-like [Chenopodium quinoa]|uniref:ankyrin repeat-containing protein BDA1-like n=1 Tax=Chenopodium quinoa TaxID=63459 RepID=UPI000B790D92|nr:ankyrin repeat-containing protein BDA1-like [Chenopodium quinoa]
MEVQTQRSQPNAMARLYDAALKGDVHSLNNLLQEDALILERCIIERGCYTQSPLHVAAKMGRLEFVKTILKKNLSMCFAHDGDGMTPIHVAAIHGQVGVLETFNRENPQAIREHTKSGETVLHLCVKHNKIDALELLLNCKNELLLNELSEQKRFNSYGLSLASKKNGKNVLVSSKVIKWDKDDVIGRSLEKTKALTAKEALKIENTENRIKDHSNALMVAASVIAAMAFEVSISPPGGFWQEDAPSSEASQLEHQAGTYIQERLNGWVVLVIWNTIALASSLSVILLLIGGLTYSRLFVAVLRFTMWIAVTAIAATYGMILVMSQSDDFAIVPAFVVAGSICLMIILILVHTHKLIVKFVIKRPIFRSCFRKYFCCSCVNDQNALEQP